MAEWITKEAACEAVRKAWYCEERVKAGFPSAEGFVIAAIRALAPPEPVGEDELVEEMAKAAHYAVYQDINGGQGDGTPEEVWSEYEDGQGKMSLRLDMRAALSVVRAHDRSAADRLRSAFNRFRSAFEWLRDESKARWDGGHPALDTGHFFTTSSQAIAEAEADLVGATDDRREADDLLRRLHEIIGLANGDDGPPKDEWSLDDPKEAVETLRSEADEVREAMRGVVEKAITFYEHVGGAGHHRDECPSDPPCYDCAFADAINSAAAKVKP